MPTIRIQLVGGPAAGEVVETEAPYQYLHVEFNAPIGFNDQGQLINTNRKEQHLYALKSTDLPNKKIGCEYRYIGRRL